MTREEEIHNASIEYVTKTHSPSINEFQTAMNIAVIKAFVTGAKYADKTMIDKACEWLKSRISIDAPIETNKNGEPLADSWLDVQMERAKLAEEFIADFRQAMEGGAK